MPCRNRLQTYGSESLPDPASKHTLPEGAQSLDLSDYRASPQEVARVESLFNLLPNSGLKVLDIGARDGFMAILLAERFTSVTALDLEMPQIVHPRVVPIKGDIRALPFDDGEFDAVLCAEVLEHIPPQHLPAACSEIARVTNTNAVIGVPFRQDLRIGRTNCRKCGSKNPPWGHLNSFDERKLLELFEPEMTPVCTDFVGLNYSRTNSFSVALLDWLGNPFGSYDQEEPCIACGAKLVPPASVPFLDRQLARVAYKLNSLQSTLYLPHANWVHVRFQKA